MWVNFSTNSNGSSQAYKVHHFMFKWNPITFFEFLRNQFGSYSFDSLVTKHIKFFMSLWCDFFLNSITWMPRLSPREIVDESFDSWAIVKLRQIHGENLLFDGLVEGMKTSPTKPELAVPKTLGPKLSIRFTFFPAYMVRKHYFQQSTIVIYLCTSDQWSGP